MLIVGLGNPGDTYVGTRHNVGFIVVDALVEKLGGGWKLEKKVGVEIATVRMKRAVGSEPWIATSKFSSDSGQAGMTKTSPGNDEVLRVVKPMTYMNRSGEAVRKLVAYYGDEVVESGIATSKLSSDSGQAGMTKTSPRNDGGLVLVHDDVDLELGRIKVQMGGGAAGHNGVQSIYDGVSSLSISSSQVVRFRCGIGRPSIQNQDEMQIAWKTDVTDWVLGRFSKEEQKTVEEMVERCVRSLEVFFTDGLQKAQSTT